MPDESEYKQAIRILQDMVNSGWSIRIQKVDRKVFIFANHFVHGHKAGVGRSVEKAALDLQESKETLV